MDTLFSLNNDVTPLFKECGGLKKRICATISEGILNTQPQDIPYIYEAGGAFNILLIETITAHIKSYNINKDRIPQICIDTVYMLQFVKDAICNASFGSSDIILSIRSNILAREITLALKK